MLTVLLKAVQRGRLSSCQIADTWLILFQTFLGTKDLIECVLLFHCLALLVK